MKNLRLLLALVALAVSIGASAYRADTLTIETKLLPEPMRVTVLVPEAASTRTDLPAVYLLNGYGGDYRSWTIIRPNLGQYADHYGMLMVLPSGMDSWYWDSPVDETMKMETFFVEELVPYINSNYPVDPSPSRQAITGLSMGGHGALWLGTRHPELWQNLGSTSGGVNITKFPKNWKIAHRLGAYDENPERWAEHTVINMVPQMAKNKQNIIFDCGVGDIFHEVNDDLHRRLVEAKVDHDYISRPGVHNSKYWNNSILYQLLYFHERFRNPVTE